MLFRYIRFRISLTLSSRGQSCGNHPKKKTKKKKKAKEKGEKEKKKV